MLRKMSATSFDGFQPMTATINHPAFSQPPDLRIQIWRYMDFTKFVALLHAGALFFVRADLLDDPFEGSYSRANESLRLTVYGKEAPKISQSIPPFYRWVREWTFLNCWHMNELESAAMWRLYARSNEAIAIRSKYQLLAQALPEKALLGMVRYIDYDTECLPEGNSFYPFVHKRKPFEHEPEVRAIIQDVPVEGEQIAMI
jgi:hypothetical protein